MKFSDDITDQEKKWWSLLFKARSQNTLKYNTKDGLETRSLNCFSREGNYGAACAKKCKAVKAFIFFL